MKIRLLTPGDEAALIAAARHFNDLELSSGRATALLADPTFLMVVAEGDLGEPMGRVYGYVLHRLEQDDLFLYEVDVDEHHQKKGVGRAILDFVTDLSKKRGFGEWFVLTEVGNVAGNALYRSAGAVTEDSPANVHVRYMR